MQLLCIDTGIRYSGWAQWHVSQGSSMPTIKLTNVTASWCMCVWKTRNLCKAYGYYGYVTDVSSRYVSSMCFLKGSITHMLQVDMEIWSLHAWRTLGMLNLLQKMKGELKQKTMPSLSSRNIRLICLYWSSLIGSWSFGCSGLGFGMPWIALHCLFIK